MKDVSLHNASFDISSHVAEMQADADYRLASIAEVEPVDKADEWQSWPVLSKTAMHGLAGEIVRLIEPHTEADPVALLVQLLAGFGNLIGRTAYFQTGADFHHTKLFAVLVGATASGRKGTSWNEIQRLLVRVDKSFEEVIRNGLSSGEGLIHHVRDEIKTKKPIKKKGGVIVDYQEEITDAVRLGLPSRTI